MSTGHPPSEDRRTRPTDRTRMAREKGAGGWVGRRGGRYSRAFIYRLDREWIAAATRCGFKATRAALELALQAGVQWKARRGTWLSGIRCSNRPPADLAGASRSFRDGVQQLIRAGLLAQEPRDGQRMNCYTILLPSVPPERQSPVRLVGKPQSR